jgi:hypothetical protein
MTVAIKDMEMPESCYDCPMLQEGWTCSFCGLTNTALIYPEGDKERIKGCPLIEVKEK